MAQCQTCRTSGANMKRCKKCNSFWCQDCATAGRGPYPKQSAGNKCPYCGTLNQIEPFR